MKVSLVNMCIYDASEARASDWLSLSKQRAAKIIKEELLHDKTVLAVSETYIDAVYYNNMFYSAAGWNTAAAVERDTKIWIASYLSY